MTTLQTMEKMLKIVKEKRSPTPEEFKEMDGVGMALVESYSNSCALMVDPFAGLAFYIQVTIDKMHEDPEAFTSRGATV